MPRTFSVKVGCAVAVPTMVLFCVFVCVCGAASAGPRATALHAVRILNTNEHGTRRLVFLITTPCIKIGPMITGKWRNNTDADLFSSFLKANIAMFRHSHYYTSFPDSTSYIEGNDMNYLRVPIICYVELFHLIPV